MPKYFIVPAPIGALDPLSLVSSVSNVLYLSGDMGITDSPSGISNWLNQGPQAELGDASQLVGSLQPSHGAGLNGRGTVLFDGLDDYLKFPLLDLPDPDFLATWFWIVLKQVSWTSGNSIFGANSTTAMRLFQSAGGSPQLGMNCGIAGAQNIGAAVGTWVRAEALYNNSASDYLKLGSSSGAPGATGGNNPSLGAFTLGAHTILGGGASNIEISLFSAWTGKPSAPEVSQLDSWITNYYGAAVNE